MGETKIERNKIMATPKKTKNGWTILVYAGIDENGKKRYQRLSAPTRKEVEKLASEFDKEMDGHSASNITMTVGDAVDAYITARETAGYSPKTIREYKAYRRTALQGLIDIKLYSVTDEMIQKEINKAAVGHSPKSVSLWWGLFGAAIRQYRKGYAPSVLMPSVKRKPVEVPDETTIKKMFAELKGDPREVPIILASVCGMRRGEISALDLKNDIDYQKGLVYVNKAYTKNENNIFELKEPKTEAGKRVISIPQWAAERLSTYAYDTNFKMYNPNQITKLYEHIRKKYNLNCTFHGLRHYYASIMLALGVPDKYAMERMGHSTNSMLKHYQESVKEKDIEINNAMNDYFSQLDETTKKTTN